MRTRWFTIRAVTENGEHRGRLAKRIRQLVSQGVSPAMGSLGCDFVVTGFRESTDA